MNIAIKPSTSTVSLLAARPLLRIVIVGDVDHGKSTLIGRLLHETGSLPEGKVEALKAVSDRRGMKFEWAFLLDALQTERDQGITIDTSQIRFRTPSRDVLLIDAPGHLEFLRNMITGAAQADAALLLIDASEGVRDQTRRHGYLLHLLGIRQVAVVVNKMDRVGYDADHFAQIKQEISSHLSGFGLAPLAVIPISARNGDGISAFTPALSWYHGQTVLTAIDSFAPALREDDQNLRFPVQAVYKFDDRRIVSGRIESGRIHVGDEIAVAPSGRVARVKSIESWPVLGAQAPQQAGSGQSVGITLDQDIFVTRGDIITLPHQRPTAARRLRARLFWLDETPLAVGATLTVRIGTSEARGTVTAIAYAVDPGQLSSIDSNVIAANSVGEVDIALSQPLAVDTHDVSVRTGRVVLEVQGRIAGGGLIMSADGETAVFSKKTAKTKATHIVSVTSAVSAEERRAKYGHNGAVVWLTGLPGSGKSTLALALERRVFERGGVAVLLDGDTLRTGLNADLGFSPEERAENVRRLGEIAAHLARNGAIAIVAAVSPSSTSRERARAAAGTHFFEVHVAAPADVCESRDPKGHYRKARAGEIPNFTGIDASYEVPAAPDLTLDTSTITVADSVVAIEKLLVAEVYKPSSPDHGL
jgi:bifunctional enzyme CysN/CysC